MSYTLYGQAGYGSACVEAALELMGQDYDLVPADPLGDDGQRSEVALVNPVGQIPALILPDGTLMTESAAILILLGDLYPQAGLSPAADAPERAAYLRWLGFLSGNLYPTFTISDGPERFTSNPAHHKDLLTHAHARRKALWLIMNEAFEGARGPYLLGERMSLLDIYAAMMSHWSPRRSWFDANCGNLKPAVEACEADPVVAAVWARNFKTGGA